MLGKDPILIVKNLLEKNWQASSTDLGSVPRITTGWYDFGSSDPQVTLTDTEEGVFSGGNTGQTAMSGSGGAVQLRTGHILGNCWAGTYEELQGAGPNGEDLSPKALSYDMGREVHRIMQSNASGTTDSNGNKQLNSLSVTDARRVIEDDNDPAVFRYECTIEYTYLEKTG